MTLEHLNELPSAPFIRTLADIFEHSVWVAAGVVAARPFDSLTSLHQAMCQVVERASEEEQLTLIRAHPDLAGKAAKAGALTKASSAEQAGAGLDRLNDEEYHRFHDLNDRYKARFDFPFILAVKGHDKHSILQAFEARLENSVAAERTTALEQIYQIARFRLEALLESEAS